jgi:serine protease Do
VLTNTHVIGNARADIRVTLSDGKERQGKLVGFDEVTDLAVVKVVARDLPTLPWGDSSKLRVAEWVLAIGNPFQLSGTVTLGIVSTVSRSGNQVGAFKDLIQTDAAINPGNSGGALVDSRGELVGINSTIYTETGGYQGIDLPSLERRARDHGGTDQTRRGALRVDRRSRLADDRSRDRSVQRAWRHGRGDGGRSTEDRRVSRRPATPDLVVAMNGQKTPDQDHLGRLVIGSAVGSTARLDVVRSGRHATIDVPIVAR